MGRLSTGVACGFFTALSPLYVSEIAPVKIRGQIGTVNQLAVVSALLMSQVLGLAALLGSRSGWPVLLGGVAVVPALLQVALLPFMPESPRYLIINKGEDEAGRRALERLRGSSASKQDVDAEFQEILSERDATSKSDEESRFGIWDLFRSRALRLPLFVCVVMHLSQQLCGMVAIFYYSTEFFVKSGVAESEAPYATLGVGAIMVTMAVVTIPLMDRLGRRTLHLAGLAGMLLFGVLLTVALNLDPSSSPGVGVFLVASTLAFVFSFAVGPSTVPWDAVQS